MIRSIRFWELNATLRVMACRRTRIAWIARGRWSSHSAFKSRRRDLLQYTIAMISQSNNLPALCFRRGSVAVQYTASSVSWPNEDNRRSHTWRKADTHWFLSLKIALAYFEHVEKHVEFDRRLGAHCMIHHWDVHETHGYRRTYHYQSFDHVDHLSRLEQTITKRELRLENIFFVWWQNLLFRGS